MSATTNETLKTAPVQVRLDKETKRELQKIAKASNVSFSVVARMAARAGVPAVREALGKLQAAE